MDLGQLGMGAAFSLSALGSAVGVGVAGMAAIGAWKKCFANNKQAPFIILAFVGAPLTQTIYGMILMGAIGRSVTAPMVRLGVGFFGGLAIGVSAWYQGKVAAVASDAFPETGKGFGNYMILLGMVESVAIFCLIFSMGVL